MTNKELENLRIQYKLWWGRIHQKSYNELAKELNKSPNSLASILWKNYPYLVSHGQRKNPLRPRKYFKITDVCLEDFIDDGWTQSQIARACGCSRQAISSRLKSKNIIAKRDGRLDSISYRKETKAYWFRIQGIQITKINKMSGGSVIGNLMKLCPELKTNGLGYGREYAVTHSWRLRPDIVAWHTKVYWYKIQGLSREEMSKRLGKSKELIAKVTIKNPELKLKAGSWKKKGHTMW
ncbi:hypothetical protein LCGC14_1565870 [marine sediment metagenome]|uniref:Uncharacterized protein n=1 Tax=marine sediment metagenome TaxID=412755 RepID=A0A0F9IL24_9ZZZZ